MSQVLLTGATGLVGGHLLRMLLNAPALNPLPRPRVGRWRYRRRI
jgi:uncharacterized protein YbjT (DUF2867 family)